MPLPARLTMGERPIGSPIGDANALSAAEYAGRKKLTRRDRFPVGIEALTRQMCNCNNQLKPQTL